jgi:hypothetical protein
LLDALRDAIEDSGFDVVGAPPPDCQRRVNAKPDHLTFDITGMTCASCSARVEKVLSPPVRAFH